jgi:outer membrane receptor for monomeric catechols
VRSDDIHAELWHTEDRQRLDARNRDAVNETLGGLYFNEEIAPWSFARLNLGGRADMMSYSVANKLGSSDPGAPGSGVGGAQQLSPKASLVVSPLQQPAAALDVYVNYGHGFHSNDVRGVFADPSVTPLTRARGSEIGSRARLWERWDLAVAFWQLDLANETVWVGDAGTTEVSGASTRKGMEIETRYEITRWLAADLDLTFTKSELKGEDHISGQGLALAPKQTWAGGLSARHSLLGGVARGGLRFYGIGDRPASDDGVLVAPGFTDFDVHLGYRHDRFDLALDIENLFNGRFRSAQFATTSRLRNEPTVGEPVPSGFSCGRNARLADGTTPGRFYGCEDVAFTPAYPFTARLTATFYLD